MERKIWGELLLSHPLVIPRKPFYLSRQHVQSQAINSGDQRSESHYYCQTVGPVSLEATGWFSSGAY